VTLIRHVRHAEGPEPAEYSRVSQDKRGELANTLVRLLVAALKARGNAAPMRALAIIARVVGAIAALGLAFTTRMEVSIDGFPDGYVTDYGKAVDAPLKILAWVEAGFGLVFLALAFAPIGIRARAVGLVVALIAFVLFAIVAQVGVPWYFGTRLGLDNGIGG
jgi:hypothetical protein